MSNLTATIILFQMSSSTPIDGICVSFNLNFPIHAANQVDAKKLYIFCGFKKTEVHQKVGPKHHLN